MMLEVCWDSLWTLSFGLSQFHGHGSWLVCEVALTHGEEVHWSVKNCCPKIRQWLVWRTRWKNNEMPRIGPLWRPSFLFEDFRFLKKFDLQRTPLPNKYCHVIFSFMLEVLHWRSLGCSVNLGQWRTHYVANHIAAFPYNSWAVHFFTIV